MRVALRKGRITLGDDGVALCQQRAQLRGVVGECSVVEFEGHA